MKTSNSISVSRSIFDPALDIDSINRNWVGYILLFLSVFVVYSNNYNCSWHFDDFNIITNNIRLHIEKIDFKTIRNGFFAHPNDHRLYRPIPMLSFSINWLLGQDNVWGYHLFNNFIHALNSCFLFLTIQLIFLTPVGKNKNLGNPSLIALFSAVLWAVHPIQTQAVTYIVQRMAAMATMFYILSILFYIKYRLMASISKKVIFAVCCLVAAVLSVLSKENAIMLPFSIFLVELVFFNQLLKKISLKNVKRLNKNKYLIVACVSLSILIISWFSYKEIYNTIISSYSQRPFTLLQRIMTEPRIINFYLSLIIFPTPNRFSIIHIFSPSDSLWNPFSTVLSILFLSVIFIFSVSQIRRRPFFSFSILFFFINHVVESSFIGLELIYEHRNYLPTLFIFIPFSLFIYKLLEIYYRKNFLVYASLTTLCISIICIFGISAHLRNSDWKTEKTLWENVLKIYPNSTRALHNLAYGYYGKTGDYKAALKLYSKALSLDWSNNSAIYRKGITYNNIAGIYYAFGLEEKAINVWNEAIKIYPSYPKAILGKSQALISLGKWKDAIKNLEQIPEAKRNAEYFNMKAFILYKQGQYGNAIRETQKALSLSPSNIESLTYLGAIYFKLENYHKSRFFLRFAYSKNKNLSILFMLLENAIFLDDSSAVEKYLKIVVHPNNREQSFSILRLSKRNEKISLSLDRIIPLISTETKSNSMKWIRSINDLTI